MLKSEAGLGAAPAGTVSGNRLTSIVYVGKSYYLWEKETPSIGVQLKSLRERSQVSMKHFVTTQFDIIMGVQSTDATATANNGGQLRQANLEDAMSMLQPLVSDGNGNGLSPVLRDMQYRSLGTSTVGAYTQVNAQRTQISDIDYEWSITQGENAQIWAYALVTLIAEQLVSIL
jgi:hypothetical protein